MVYLHEVRRVMFILQEELATYKVWCCNNQYCSQSMCMHRNKKIDQLKTSLKYIEAAYRILLSNRRFL